MVFYRSKLLNTLFYLKLIGGKSTSVDSTNDNNYYLAMDKQPLPTLEPLDNALPTKQDTSVLRQRFHSAELFGTAREVVIEHAGEEYRLRLTRQGKLILTK
jgi:hemin uptake protein HemP